ncbi:ABC transporter substrate-binding protein [Propionibacteriaceae bacterium Y1685]|uniref:ABC transporter substrate-binding protein n=1 Tax=Microlunatus sp. Y1700 TaxID=3418487 RepID=UPI003B7F7B49
MHPPRTTRPRGPLAVLTALLIMLLTLAGCGTEAAPGGAESSSAATGGFPRSVQVGETTVTLEKRPEAIVVLSPSLTETVYGVGAGGQVKAVDSLSNYPEGVPTTDLSAFKPNAEAIAGMAPDLVLLSNDQDNIVQALTDLSIPVALLESAATLEDAYAQMVTIGELTGHDDEGKALAAEVQQTVEQAADSVADARELNYYWELGPEMYSATSDTFMGSVLKKFKLTSIADDAPDAASTGGYPQLNAEFIIDADPDLIFVTGGAAAAVKKRPGWDVTRAVKDEHGVVGLDDDISSRWGPRLGDLAETIATSVKQVQ